MARPSIWRPPFDPTAEYVASQRKELRFGGRLFEPGETFDVKTTERMKRILYEGRYLDRKDDFNPQHLPIVHKQQDNATQDPPGESDPATDAPADAAGQQDSAPAPADQTDPQQDENADPPGESRQVLSVKSLGHGWYIVEDQDGNQVSPKKMRQKEAEAFAADPD